MENVVFLLPQPLWKTQWTSLALLPLALQQALPLYFQPSKISFLCSHWGYSWKFCTTSKSQHKAVDEQRTECVSQENSSMPGPAQPPRAREQGSSHRERGLQKGSKMAGRYSHSYHCYIPSSHITSIPKNECWFAKPRNWAGLSPFGAGRAHKSYPWDFILLAQTDKATDCCGHPSVPWHTQRQQHPHGDLTAPPSFPAGTQQLENGRGLQKTHEWYRRLLSLCWSPVPAFPDLLMWFLTTFWGGKNTHNKFFPAFQYERD